MLYVLLPNGKVIKWNNNTYVQHDNTPVDWVMTGTNYTALQNQIASIQPNVGGEFKTWSVASQRVKLSEIINYEPTAVIAIFQLEDAVAQTQAFFNYISHDMQWWITTKNTTARSAGQSSLLTCRFDDLCYMANNPPFPTTVSLILFK